MAFKMKGFPFAGKSPIKDKTRNPSYPGSHNYAHMLHDEGKGPDPHAKKGASTLDFDETKAPLNQKEVDMNTVYKRLDNSGWLKDAEGYSAKELAAMSDERRAGIINDYEPGSFDRMVAKIKKELKNN